MDTTESYDDLAEAYNLIFGERGTPITSRTAQLDGLIRQNLGLRSSVGIRVLDAACGIGTQALALAAKGYCVTGSDPSARAVAHAAAEAVPQGFTNLSRFLVADLANLSSAASDMRYFDVVLALDNALPHFLSDGEVTQALRECYRCLRPCGLCVISVPDYDAVQREPGAVQLHPCGVLRRTTSSGALEKVVAWQTWEWDGEGRTYELSTYIVFDSGHAQPVVRVRRSRLYAVGLQTLEICMQAAGFEQVRVLREPSSNPVLVGFAPGTRVAGPGP